MAPEILLGQPYNESVDVYSYGILLYELFSETIPYAGSDTPSYSDSDPVVCEGTDVAQEGIKLSCGDSPKRFVHLALAITQGHRPNLGYIPRHCPPALLYVTLFLVLIGQKGVEVHPRRSFYSEKSCLFPNPGSRSNSGDAMLIRLILVA